jgi:hypothetical protein
LNGLCAVCVCVASEKCEDAAYLREPLSNP